MKKTLIIIVAIFLAFGLFYFSKNFNFNKKSTLPVIKPKPEKTVYNFLLLWFGGAHEGTYLTDTVMVANIDTKINTDKFR